MLVRKLDTASPNSQVLISAALSFHIPDYLRHLSRRRKSIGPRIYDTPATRLNADILLILLQTSLWPGEALVSNCYLAYDEIDHLPPVGRE